jgi:deazaflavin-dependent oxidoreductase (nitroreductase family)
MERDFRLFCDGQAAVCHSEPMSVVRKAGMLLLRGALATQVWIYRRTKGRRAGSVRGTPVLLLTTTGRKSGQRKTRPVGYLPDGDRFLVCGSNGGSDHPSAWSLNLRANPDATVEVGAKTLSVTASEITGEEYETAWAKYIAAYPGFAGYRTKTKRHLPIFILDERAK